MTGTTLHNPDMYMVDLRKILSQGRKRIGLLVGAGASAAVRVDAEGRIADDGDPLIPDVAQLTENILESLSKDDQTVIGRFTSELGDAPDIEAILTQIRKLAQAIGAAVVHGLNADEYSSLADRICKKIGEKVAVKLPDEPNPFSEFVRWIGGTQREFPIEIFTPNYDLLLEEAFERARLPYFDGFSGAHQPFFDANSIYDDVLPSRWSRLWKIHGSLGWDIAGDSIIRTGDRKATALIYPDHLKYDQITRQPYSALFERLRKFLTTPDSLLLCSGFSFCDAHIASVLDETLAANAHTAAIAFQFRNLAEEPFAESLALRRSNLSVYARDGAVINGVAGAWQRGKPRSDEWESISRTFWDQRPVDDGGSFLLGDFGKLARFFLWAQVSELGLGDNSARIEAAIVVAEPEKPSTGESSGDENA